MTLWVWTGGRPSNSAHLLSVEEGIKRMIKGKFVKPEDTIVNWGSTMLCHIIGPKVLNNPIHVRRAVNKFFAFSALAGSNVSVVPWTANEAVAKEWQDNGSVIIARKVLTGHSGEGIIIVEKGEAIPQAPLYTKYLFKVKEFRVHAARDKVWATHQKVRDPDREPTCWKIRSHDNGFIFQRNNIPDNEARDKLAMAAIKALNLDFGAVDIIEDKKGNFYVLEVNTAPGLEGQTVNTYATGLKELASDAAA